MVFGAVNRIVVADMEVGGVGRNFEFVLTWDAAEIFVFSRRGNFTDAEDSGFLVGVAGESAAEGVAAWVFLAGEIHWYHGELQGRAALNEQNVVVVAELHEFENVSLSLIVNFLVGFGTVTDFDYGHSGIVEVKKFGLSFLQDFERQSCRSWIKIVNTLQLKAPPQIF